MTKPCKVTAKFEMLIESLSTCFCAIHPDSTTQSIPANIPRHLPRPRRLATSAVYVIQVGRRKLAVLHYPR